MRLVLLTLLSVALILVLILLGYSLTRRDRLKSVYFTVLSAAVAFYLYGYILEVLSPAMEAALTALRVQNVGIPLIGPFMLLSVLSICDFSYHRLLPVFLACYGFLMSAAVLFNDYHFLYYTAYEWQSMGDLNFLYLSHGPLYYVQQGAVVVCTLVSWAVFFRRLRQMSSKTRPRVLLMAGGVLLSFLVNFLYMARSFRGIDPTPLSLTVSLLLVGVCIFRYKLFDFVTIASQTAFYTMEDAVVVLDESWRYRFANQSAYRLFPYLSDLLSSEPITCLTGWPEQLQKRTEMEMELELADSSGKARMFQVRIGEVRGGNVIYGWAVTFHDITESARLLRQMENLAITDPLTGIYNRRHFKVLVQAELELAKRESLPASLVMFDLDHFKRINDTYGHQAGDEALVGLTAIVQEELRPYDIFARYGGEEFMVFSVGMNMNNAVQFAQRLCSRISREKLSYQNQTLQITASFGVVEIPDTLTLDAAIMAVDQAMYQAKEQGRNCVAAREVGKVKVGANG